MVGIDEITPAFGIVREYLDRKKLAEIGFSTSIDDLEVFDAQAFICVADEIVKAERDVLPKLRPEAANGKRNNSNQA